MRAMLVANFACYNPTMIEQDATTIGEQIQKAAVDLLVTRGEHYASAVLSSCRLAWSWSGETWMSGARTCKGVDVTLSGPPAVYELLRKIKGLEGRRLGGESGTAAAIRDALQTAVEAVLANSYLDSILRKMETAPPFEGWREEYLADIRGDKAPGNQAVVASDAPAFARNGLHLRSKTEMALAQEFSRKNVLYFPLPAAVCGEEKREPDFLVCNQQGKWGILEVHGDEFHPPQTAAREHERGRWFKERGVKLFEVYDARECYHHPDSIVDKFLKLLARS